MIEIKRLKENNNHYLVMKNTGFGSEAKICLNQGGALTLLKLNNKTIIEDMAPLEYEDTYASSILFPFANRIKNGEYSFKGKQYKLNCNEKGRDNALHGLIYNKEFKCIEKKFFSKYLQVKLSYLDKGQAKGFPFKYKVYLTYKLKKEALSLKVTVKNLSKSTFPFTLGWHPYFVSSDLKNSFVEFESDKKLKLDSQLITSNLINVKQKRPLQIKNNQLDDGYLLNGNKVVFKTPSYDLKIKSSAKENFLQLYRPNRKNTIAIEPTTGVSDSFNNQIGIQTLDSNATYKLKWSITLK